MTVTLDPKVVEALHARGGTWAVYQHQAHPSSRAGHIKCLRFGEGCTHLVPPPRPPDTGHSLGWPYVLLGTLDAAKLDVTAVNITLESA